MSRLARLVDSGIKFFLILFFLSIPLSIALENLFGGIVLLLWLMKSIFIKRPAFKKIREIKIFLMLYFVAIAISTFFGADPTYSLKNAHTHLKFLLFLPLVSEINSMQELKKYIILLVIALTGNSIFAIIQHFQGVERVGGTYFFYMTFAGMASLLSFMILYLAVSEKRRGVKIIWSIAYLIVLLAIIFTYTRNAWLGLIVGLLAFSIVYLRKYSVFVVILLILFYFLLPQNVHTRFKSIFYYKKDGSARARMMMWETAPNILKDYWYRGIGLNNLEKVFPKYTKYKFLNTYNHLHNNYLQVFTEFGIIGIIAFLYLLIMTLITSYKCYLQSRNLLFLAIFSAIVSFSISGIFEYSFGDSEVAISLISIISLLFAAKNIVFLDKTNGRHI